MKNVILAALVIGTGIAQANTRDAAVKGAKQGINAAKGGRAAVGSVGTAATVATAQNIATLVASVMTQFKKPEARVSAFIAELSRIPGLDAQSRGELADAFKVGLLNRGCIGKVENAEAFKNLGGLVAEPTKVLTGANETIDGLARVRSNPDLNKNNAIEPAERQAADDAAKRITEVTKLVVGAYAKQHNKTAQQAAEVVKTLSEKCGVSPVIGAEAVTAAKVM